MRKTLIAISAVLAAAIALCCTTARLMSDVAEFTNEKRCEAISSADAGDFKGAAARMDEIYERWEALGPTLELVADHNSLDETRERIDEAREQLAHGLHDEFFVTAHILGDAVDSLSEHEFFSLSNLL